MGNLSKTIPRDQRERKERERERGGGGQQQKELSVFCKNKNSWHCIHNLIFTPQVF
jgi:hypothetical protein